MVAAGISFSGATTGKNHREQERNIRKRGMNAGNKKALKERHQKTQNETTGLQAVLQAIAPGPRGGGGTRSCD